ncbi:hypothetical protein R3P38DRAFT_3597930 [Favolaschia claudopus]|uniref:DUF6534 domain-containing protein n=1 Tax=Favolaschia claudopus TaxID=2862362 RepID=A0AAW0AF15_9AGAR
MDSSIVTFDAHGTIGAYQIGVLLSCVLLGITTLQAYMICEVAHTICIAHALYQYTILDFGHAERILTRLPLGLDIAVFFSALIEQAVEAFFAVRIYSLSRKLTIPTLICLLSFVRFVGSLLVFVMTVRLPSLQSYLVSWGWLSTTCWCAGAANDVLTTGTLVTLLYCQRNLLQRRTYITMKDKMIWIAIFLISSRMYSNSLLASLNSRETLRSMNNQDSHISLGVTHAPREESETIESLATQTRRNFPHTPLFFSAMIIAARTEASLHLRALTIR